MTISIGGIVLSDDLVWEDEFDTATVPRNIVPTLGFENIVQEMDVQVNRTVTLLAMRDGDALYGWFTRTQAKQLKALEGSPAAITLVYEDQTLTVKILAGGVKLRPVLARANQADDDLYTGTITMIEV